MTPPDRPTGTGTPRGGADDALTREDAGYRPGLAHRQVQMIAIGGAIGSGLFLGSGGRLASAGPALFVVYALCGGFVFLVLRALGELVLHRPTSGSFVSYAREFHGEKVAYVAGWLYFLNWAMVSIVDITAAATYLHYWEALRPVPQWVFALAALVVVLAANLVSVRAFGELEFWAALVKVAALVVFLVVGTVFLVGRFDVQGRPTGFGMVADAGGFAPTGILPLVVVIGGVVFAFAAVELVGTAAGETRDPQAVMPRAINSVVLRIAFFYVGSLVLLALLLPYGDYDAAESPFVTFFSRIGVPGSGTVMNLVVLTAALSSLNAGLYSTGRILRSMAVNGSAPAVTARMSSTGVPWVGIVLTSAIALLGVGLNAVVPEQAFEIVLNLSAIGIVSSWGTIVICQLRLVAWSRRGLLERPAFRMPGAPWTGWLTLVFLVGVLVLTALDYPVGTFTVGSLVIVGPALVAGWFLCRGRVRALAAQERG